VSDIDQHAFESLAFMLRSNPKWKRDEIVKFFASHRVELSPLCDSCTADHHKWEEQVNKLAKEISASFDEWSKRWTA
jgi:hypothetical protein